MRLPCLSILAAILCCHLCVCERDASVTLWNANSNVRVISPGWSWDLQGNPANKIVGELVVPLSELKMEDEARKSWIFAVKSNDPEFFRLTEQAEFLGAAAVLVLNHDRVDTQNFNQSSVPFVFVGNNSSALSVMVDSARDGDVAVLVAVDWSQVEHANRGKRRLKTANDVAAGPVLVKDSVGLIVFLVIAITMLLAVYASAFLFLVKGEGCRCQHSNPCCGLPSCPCSVFGTHVYMLETDLATGVSKYIPCWGVKYLLFNKTLWSSFIGWLGLIGSLVLYCRTIRFSNIGRSVWWSNMPFFMLFASLVACLTLYSVELYIAFRVARHLEPRDEMIPLTVGDDDESGGDDAGDASDDDGDLGGGGDMAGQLRRRMPSAKKRRSRLPSVERATASVTVALYEWAGTSRRLNFVEFVCGCLFLGAIGMMFIFSTSSVVFKEKWLKISTGDIWTIEGAYGANSFSKSFRLRSACFAGKPSALVVWKSCKVTSGTATLFGTPELTSAVQTMTSFELTRMTITVEKRLIQSVFAASNVSVTSAWGGISCRGEASIWCKEYLPMFATTDTKLVMDRIASSNGASGSTSSSDVVVLSLLTLVIGACLAPCFVMWVCFYPFFWRYRISGVDDYHPIADAKI